MLSHPTEQEARLAKGAGRADASAFEEAALASAQKRAPPAADALERVRDRVREVRDLTLEIEDREAALSALKQRRYEMLSKTLPDMFQELGINTLGLDAEKNMPEFVARSAPYYHANIGADWPEEKREAAFAWLRANDLGDLIKAVFQIEFGMKTTKQQKELRAALRKLKLDYTATETVPWNSLTAAVRTMIEREHHTPPLATLGATVGTVVTVKEVKPKIDNRSK